MCARFSLYATPAQIAKLLDIEVPESIPRYNIAPTQMILGAVERDGKRQLREFRWGLIPSWAKDPKIGNKMINARSETILEKSSFRTAFQKRRCIVPSSGFFEWKHETIQQQATAKPKSASLFEEYDIDPPQSTKSTVIKQPYLVGLESGEPFGLAGLYEYWKDPAGELVRSCTILTTRPNSLIAPLHDRMPVIVRQPDIATWLDCEEADLSDVESLLEPLPALDMIAVPVSPDVNNPNNDCPELVVGLAQR